MKKFLCVLLVIVLLFSLAGCSKRSGDKEFDTNRFVVVHATKGMDYYKETIFRDIETDVLYLGVRDPVGHLAITVLMQPDGTPVTYSEYTAAHALSK